MTIGTEVVVDLARERRIRDTFELLNIDAATVSRWENGKVAVDRAALATLAAAASSASYH